MNNKINEALICFCEDMNRIDKFLVNLVKKKEKTEMTNIRDYRGDITTNPKDTESIVKGYDK